MMHKVMNLVRHVDLLLVVGQVRVVVELQEQPLEPGNVVRPVWGEVLRHAHPMQRPQGGQVVIHQRGDGIRQKFLQTRQQGVHYPPDGGASEFSTSSL